jgi:cytochrome oxidase Cu insertion factor (SCO1/SenC/PrrC family)
MTALRRNRRQMLLIGILFLGPFVLAWLLYFNFPQLQPEGRLNRGQLINPAQPLATLTLTTMQNTPADLALLKGKWTLVQLGAERCDELCAKHLYMTRQVRTRLGRDRSRVQRVYVAPDATALASVHDALAGEQPDLVWTADAGAAGQRLADFLHPQDANAIYLFDPLGNWVMVHPGVGDPKQFDPYMAALYADLKQLLKLSQID